MLGLCNYRINKIWSNWHIIHLALRNGTTQASSSGFLTKQFILDDNLENVISDSIKGFLQLVFFCIGLLFIINSFFFLIWAGVPMIAAACFSLSIISFILCYRLRITVDSEVSNDKQTQTDNALKLILALFCFFIVLFLYF